MGGRSLNRALLTVVVVLSAASCESPGLREGSVVASLTAEGQVLVGQLTCDSDRMPARKSAILWRYTGDRNVPLEKLWEGRLRESVATLPSSGVDLFTAYEYVDGSLGDVDSLDRLDDQLDLSVVLQFSGAADLPLAKARAQPNTYFYKGHSGTFADLQDEFCAS